MSYHKEHAFFFFFNKFLDLHLIFLCIYVPIKPSKATTTSIRQISVPIKPSKATTTSISQISVLFFQTLNLSYLPDNFFI
jgi:hypothetical protein